MDGDEPVGEGGPPASAGGDEPADSPGERRRRFVAAIVRARREDVAVRFVATPGSHDEPVGVEYRDRTLRLEVDDEERARLEDLRADYHVFKLKQPETRRAADGVVYLSAVTDPKHAADFLEALFRAVYGAGDAYALAVE